MKAGYELEFEDAFDGDALDESRWLPHYLPQWSTRERSAARYAVGGGRLRLLIEADQEPWCPELDGEVRVSSLQTGVFAGPVGSAIGQHRFHPDAVVREEQENVRLYTPAYGLIELRAQALDDPACMVALWMIGYEDEPARSAEICVCEIFGRDVGPDTAAVGMGVHPFGDPAISDEFAAEPVAIDARELHVYAAEWTPEQVAFSVDGRHVKTVRQSPAYPMQLMLGIYEFPGERRTGPYPKEFVVDYVRGYRFQFKLIAPPPLAAAGAPLDDDLVGCRGSDLPLVRTVWTTNEDVRERARCPAREGDPLTIRRPDRAEEIGTRLAEALQDVAVEIDDHNAATGRGEHRLSIGREASGILELVCRDCPRLPAFDVHDHQRALRFLR